ncbi:TonB-dependent receptor [Mucilaginibacter lacusdianchii]|uniref:TonB-dependent receptor n=1 Tax=Mucilaginibacter lacusdianchii TaxID=2684211 RepID=UPI001E641948|nr:TonB-dependent receptor [Mucilaginibacter sp. JXJ CY 39]
MKHSTPRLLSYSLLLFLLVAIQSGYAQTAGKLSGKITDTKTGETLIGATVLIQGTNLGAAANVTGDYTVVNIPAGTYTVLVRYVGYQNKLISDVQIKANAATPLNITLDQANTQQLKEVTVRATYRQESVNSLYAQQKNRAVISDGISSDQIARSPDRSTGEALRRVSGTTIQDNRFVIVRGLSDRYNNARLDNTTLPSTEPNRKAFSFDIVPANLVDNIVISKTATPDLPSDFAGGSIQIITKDIPDQNFLTLSAGASYNSQSTFKDFNYGPRFTENYFAFDNYRQLPSNFPKSEEDFDNLSSQQQISALRRLPRVWTIGQSKATPYQDYQASIGRVKEFKNGGRFGFVGSLTYHNNETVTPEITRDYFVYNFSDRANLFSTNIGGLANFSYTKGKNKFSFKNLYNRILDDKYTYRTGYDESRGSDIQYYAIDMLIKGLFKTTLEGEHQLNDKNKLNWNLSYANVVNIQPDQRKVGYQRNITDRNNPNVPFLSTSTSINRENNRLFSNLNEDLFNGSVNDQYNFNMFSKPAILKVGLGGQYRKRSFDARLIGLALNAADPDIQSRPLSTLYGLDLINSGAYRFEEITGPGDSYDGHSYTAFGYAMLDNRIGDKSRVVWGLRAEKFNLDLTPMGVINQDAHLDNLDLLPSVNYTYSLTTKSNFRASYYRTLARPEFRELAVFSYYDYENIFTLQGNPNLKRTLIDNFDLRYEIFPGAGEVLSVSAFYKHFNNAIETALEDRNSTPQIDYINTKKATVYGAELEVRHSLSFVDNGSAWLKNIFLYANGSLIKSIVKNPTNGDLYLHAERPLVGQAPYSINAGLQYNAFQNKLNLSALYNRIGRRILYIGRSKFEDVWEAPRDVLDFQASYRVLKGKGQIKLNTSNLLNSRTLFYFDYTKDHKYSGASTITDSSTGAVRSDEIFNKYFTGITISLSVNYTF